MTEENENIAVDLEIIESPTQIAEDTFEFYGIPDSFNLYRIPDSDFKIIEILSKFNLGKNYINTATGITILACAEELEVDSVNILEKIRWL